MGGMRLIPEAAPPLRTATGRAFAVALGAPILGFCLFGDCQSVRTGRVLGSILGEVTAALTDAGTQWMVFTCAGIYFVGFVTLRRRSPSLGGDFWLLGLLAVVAVAYQPVEKGHFPGFPLLRSGWAELPA